MQQAALFRRERQLGVVNAVLWFWVLSAIICEICGRIGRSHIQKTMSMNIKNNNNDRSRVSRGNKIQKLRKFRANEYRVKFTWTMLSAAEILYKKNGLYCSRNFRKRALNTPKGVRKSQQKVHASESRVKFTWTMPSAAELLQWRKSCVSGISQGNFMLAFLGTFRCVSCKRFLLLKQLSLVSAFYFREKRVNGR